MLPFIEREEDAMSGQLAPLQLGPGEGRTVLNPVGGPITFKARGEQTGGTLTVLESVVARSEGPPLHVHAREDELLYVLDGEFRFRLGDEVRPAPAGSSVYVPQGIAHCFQNVDARPARLLVAFTPSGMERFFDRFAELTSDHAGPEAFGMAGMEVGMDVVGPPLARSHPL